MNKAGNFIKKHAGDVVEFGKEVIPQHMLNKLAEEAVMSYAPEAAPVLLPVVKRGIAVGYKHDFTKPMSGQNAKADIMDIVRDEKEKMKSELKSGARQMAKDQSRAYMKSWYYDQESDRENGDYDGDGIKGPGKLAKHLQNHLQLHGGSLKSIRKGLESFGKDVKNNSKLITRLAGQTVISQLPPGLQPVANYGLSRGLDQMPSGTGLKKNKLVKGSLEAKQYMASIRNKRKLTASTSGGSFLPI